jgi:hypothetical protein
LLAVGVAEAFVAADKAVLAVVGAYIIAELKLVVLDVDPIDTFEVILWIADGRGPTTFLNASLAFEL